MRFEVICVIIQYILYYVYEALYSFKLFWSSLKEGVEGIAHKSLNRKLLGVLFSGTATRMGVPISYSGTDPREELYITSISGSKDPKMLAFQQAFQKTAAGQTERLFMYIDMPTSVIS